MLKDILEYEKRLLADRQELLRLTEEHLAEEDEAVQDKLNFFRSELMHLNHQYELLKHEVEKGKRQQVAQPVQPQMVDPQPVQPQVVDPQPIQPEPVQPTLQSEMKWPKEDVSMEKPIAEKASDLEKKVGTSLMGILASGLIFVSLILFATLLMPYITEGMKLAACYTVSVAITGFALIKLHKDPESRFYLILAGCGVGALYISILLTNIYFKFIGDITLFVLIAIWVVFVCYLSKSKSSMFHLVGQLGVTISIVFGCNLCMDKNDMVKFVSLSIYYVIAFGTLYFTHLEREFARNKIANIFGCINMIMLIIAAQNIIVDDYNPYYIFMMVVVLVHLVMVLISKWEETAVSYGIFASFYAFMLGCFIDSYLKSDEIIGIAIYLVAMSVFFIMEFKEKEEKAGQIFAQIAMVLLAWHSVSFIDMLYEHGFILLLVAPSILVGFFRRNTVCRYIGLSMMWIYLFNFVGIYEQFAVGFVTLSAIYALLWWQKECDSIAFKVNLHILGLIYILILGSLLLVELDFRFSTGAGTIFIALAVFNTAMSKSCFAKNLWTGEKENPVFYNLVNMALMTAGLIIIAAETPLHIPVILVSLVLFMLNSKNLLEKFPNIVAGIYVGLKFTILMIAILGSFDAANYVVSSCCILLAIGCIVIGFMRDYKYLRIYGLILSMISVFKLIMVDIRYENTLGNAISFFVSGILCFAISLIYNYIDKRIKKEE